MARKETIIIEAQTDGAVKEVNKLKNSLSEVKGEAGKTSKSIEDVSGNGGAIAILDQLTGGLATRFRDAFEATKLFNFSLKGMRTALIATGIGAFVVILGAVVAYWDEIVDLIEQTSKKLQQQIDLSREKLDDLGYEIKLLEAKEKILIAEGKSTEEIVEQKRKIIIIQQEQNTLLLENLKTQLEREKSQIREVTLWEKTKIATLNALKLYGLAAEATADSILGNEEQRKNLKDISKQLEDSALRAEALKLALLELDKKPEPKGGKETKTDKTRDDSEKQRQLEVDEKLKTLLAIEELENEFLESKLEREQLEENQVREKYFNLIEAAREAGLETLLLEEAQQQALNEIKEKYDEINLRRNKERIKNELEQEKIAQEAKESIQNAQIDNVSSASKLIAIIGEKNKKVQAAAIIAENAAGIAKTIISTQAANAGALATPQAILTSGAAAIPVIAANNIASGISVATSIAATVKALSKLGGGGSPSGGSVGTSTGGGGGGASAPSFNLVQGSGTNQIAESIGQQNRPIQAFVVSGSVTTGQELDRNIIESSTI